MKPRKLKQTYRRVLWTLNIWKHCVHAQKIRLSFSWAHHTICCCCCCSVTKSCLTLRYHELQYARFPCPSPSPWICSNSCPLSHWCHLTISSSSIPLSPCPQSFPVSGSFPKSRLFASGGQSIGASVPASVLPVNNQGWFPLWLCSKLSTLSHSSHRHWLTAFGS